MKHTLHQLAAGVVASLAVAVALPATASARDVSTSFGARYDPAKCHVSSAYWKGHRRFYLSSRSQGGCMTSPWWSGAHPVMVSYGPTAAPWYPGSGVHHGVDIDMPAGTAVRSAVAGWVHVRPGTLGAAYGTRRMLVRSGGKDYVFGHMSRLAVHDRQYVRKGQVIGWSGMSGVESEDGPHLHFEVRPAGTSYRSAVNPWSYSRVHRI